MLNRKQIPCQAHIYRIQDAGISYACPLLARSNRFIRHLRGEWLRSAVQLVRTPARKLVYRTLLLSST